MLERNRMKIEKNAIYFVSCVCLLASIPHLSGEYSWLGIILNCLTAWIAYFCFANFFQDDNIGILCSALYTLSVFRIGLIQAVAYRELLAFAFIPIVLYGWYLLLYGDIMDRRYKNAWLVLGLGYTAIVLTHMQTFIITLIVTGLLCIGQIKKLVNKHRFIQLLGGGLFTICGAVVGAFLCREYYMAELNNMRLASEQMIQPNGLYVIHLLYHFWNEDIRLISEEMGLEYFAVTGMGFVLVFAVLFLVILWYSNKLEENNHTQTPFAKVCAILACITMMLSLNIFPWDRIQLLFPLAGMVVGGLQYPGRFLGWGTLLGVFALGYELWHFRKNNKKIYWIGVIIVGVSVVTSGLYYLDYVAKM